MQTGTSCLFYKLNNWSEKCERENALRSSNFPVKPGAEEIEGQAAAEFDATFKRLHGCGIDGGGILPL